MGLFDRFKRKAATIAPPAPKANASEKEIIAMLQSSRSSSGANVTVESALTFPAVLACVRVLGESVAGLPLITYRRLADGGKERAIDHPLYTVLHDSPNPDMTSFQWRETSMAHRLLWGNSYSEIITDGAGRVRELWPLLPQFMTVKRNKAGQLIYEYRDPIKGLTTYASEDIYHVPGLSMNGLVGMSMIAVARESIGMGLTLREHGARLFANGAMTGGFLTHPGVMTDDAYKRLLDSFTQKYVGVENTGKPVLLEEGTTFTPTTMPNDDAQFLQTMKFTIEDVARMFRVPLPFVGDLDRATFSNIEQLSLDFVVHSLRPHLVREEQTIGHRLLTPAERKQYFAEYLVDGLLRGDLKTRTDSYGSAIQNGWMTRNQARALENMNSGGAELDKYLVPLNMQVVS